MNNNNEEKDNPNGGGAAVLVRNSRARQMRADADVRASVTGDPPVIELDDDAFGEVFTTDLGKGETRADLSKTQIELCPCCGTVKSIISREEAIAMMVPEYQEDSDEIDENTLGAVFAGIISRDFGAGARKGGAV